MMGFVFDVLDWFMRRSPPEPESPAAHKREKYRQRVGVDLAVAGVVSLFVLSFGLFPNVFPGFARASDMVKFQVTQIDKDILDYDRENCLAGAGTKLVYMDRVQRLMEEYQRLTGTIYPLPACDRL